MHLWLDMSGMAKHVQRRRIFIAVTLLFSLPVSIIFLLSWGLPSKPFTRSLDSYFTSGIPWIPSNTKTPCWKTAPALYHCFRALTPGSTNNPLRSATNMEALIVPTQPWHPSRCIDGFFTSGEPCSAHSPTKLDVVWTWVNGSDDLHQQALWDAAESLSAQPRKNTVGVTSGKLYRDHDELKYSMRSVLQHFGGHTTKFHILTADYPHPDDRSPFRLGQIPQWLDYKAMDQWRHGHISLTLQHHSQIFTDSHLPSFNSFSIESQLLALHDLSDYHVYLNDDHFMTKNLAATDFYSSPFGLVLRFSPNLLVEAAEWPNQDASGEWGPLQYSNWLLDQRFGQRRRPYLAHVSKVISRPHFAEISSIWSKEFLDTSGHRFRGGRDVYSAFILTHFVVERAREILLWSWIVGTIGAGDDTWDAEEGEKAWKILGGDENTKEIRVTLRQRSTLSPERLESLFEEAGEEPPKETVYLLSGMDVYPYSMLNGVRLQQWPRVSNGNPTSSEKFTRYSWANCKLVREKCFGSRKQASEVFKHVAFDNTECGDCIINALLRASGPVGLSAFLPPSGRVYPPAGVHTPPMPIPENAPVLLPLTKNWQTTDFTLRSCLRSWGPVHVRGWILRAMARYKYVVGETPYEFIQMGYHTQLQAQLKKLRPDIALLAVNDDVKAKPELVNPIFIEWMANRWSTSAEWEL